MTTQMIPKATATVVCDLCEEPIDTYSNTDRAALNWGTTPMAALASSRPRHFLFFRRSSGRGSAAPKGDYRNFTWDFHGECLVTALEPLITTRAGS